MTDSITRKIAKKLHKRTVAYVGTFFEDNKDLVKPESPTLSPKAKEIKNYITSGSCDFGCQTDSVIKIIELLLSEKLYINGDDSSEDGPFLETGTSKPGLVFKNLDEDQGTEIGTIFMTISNDCDDFLNNTGDTRYSEITYTINKFSIPTVDEIETFIKSVTVEKLEEYLLLV
jgi:hypothetical protein